MPSVIFHYDTSGVVGFTDGSTAAAVRRAASKAGGDALRKMRTETTTTVRQRKRLKLGRVRDGLTLTFPRGVREVEDMEWTMNVSGEPVPAIDYPHTGGMGRGKGASVGINVGKSKLIAGAFIATMKNGHRGVFIREPSALSPFRPTKRGRLHRVGRLPIKELFTTRISDVFHDSGMIPQALQRASSVFEAGFARLLPLELAKVD